MRSVQRLHTRTRSELSVLVNAVCIRTQPSRTFAAGEEVRVCSFYSAHTLLRSGAVNEEGAA